jgi:hypothetical protein
MAEVTEPGIRKAGHEAGDAARWQRNIEARTLAPETPLGTAE